MNTAGSFLRLTILCAVGALTACSGQLNDSRYATGSNSLVASSDYQALYVTNPDQGTVSKIDVETGDVTEIEVGIEPVRIARAGDTLFASLRGERALAVLNEVDGQLTVSARIELGAEPFGVVADEKGRSVYVASQLGGTVDEIDVETLTVVRTFEVRGQPRFLALHPSGNHLYVGSAMGGILTDLNLKTGEAAEVSMPENVGADPTTLDPVVLTPRITGDLSVSPDGTALAIPTLFINNTSPVSPPNLDTVNDDDVMSDGYAGGGPSGTRRFNPSVVLIVTNHDGKLRTDLNDTLLVQGFGRDQVIASYPSSSTFAPDGETLVLTLEGSDANLVVSVPDSIGDQGVNRQGRHMDAAVSVMEDGMGGSTLLFSDTETILTGSAPRGVAFVDDAQAFVHTGFDYSVADMTFEVAADRIAGRQQNSGHGRAGNSTPIELEVVDGDEEFTPSGPDPVIAETSRPVSGEILPPDLAEGRALFYSASNEQMALPGASVSCATCHMEGRLDGLTWQFDDGGRQTPSLAGMVSMTAPVTWNDEVETVFDEVVITSQGRMGGKGLAEAQAMNVAAYIDFTPLPDTPNRGSVSDTVQRGKELFDSEAVGCADCHSGEALTDNERYDMFGMENVRTRGLQGVAASAPYLHDGSAPTLRSVLTRAGDGEMGTTSMLSQAQLTDLEEYLKSL